MFSEAAGDPRVLTRERLKKQIEHSYRAANPVAPPYWLRAGAPAETAVYAGGKPYTVIGHRWGDDGYFFSLRVRTVTPP
jgi:hypothetical protein